MDRSVDCQKIDSCAISCDFSSKVVYRGYRCLRRFGIGIGTLFKECMTTWPMPEPVHGRPVESQTPSS